MTRSAGCSPRCARPAASTRSVSAGSSTATASARCTATTATWPRGGDTGDPRPTRSPGSSSTSTAASCGGTCSRRPVASTRGSATPSSSTGSAGCCGSCRTPTPSTSWTPSPMCAGSDRARSRRIGSGWSPNGSPPSSATPSRRACRPPSWTRRSPTSRPGARSTSVSSPPWCQPASSSSTAYQRAQDADSGIWARPRPGTRTSSNRSPHCATPGPPACSWSRSRTRAVR